MLTGKVNADLEVVLRLTVRGETGPSERVKVIIDTGFNGSLTLPPDVIARLGLAWDQYGRAILADGSESFFNVYRGVVVWDRRRRGVPVAELDASPLGGMELLDGHELKIEARPGGKVTIKPLRRRRRPGR